MNRHLTTVMATLCFAMAVQAEVGGVMLPALPTSAGLGTAVYSASSCYRAGTDTAQVDFDLGAPKTISGVTFKLSSHGSAQTRMKNFAILASADGVHYDTIFTNANRTLVQDGVTYMTYPVEPQFTGPYRYYRAYDKNNVCLCDLRLLSTDLAVMGNRPEAWSDRTQMGAAADASIVFGGSLLSSPAGTAHVYAAYADRDLGTSFAAWQTGGTLVDFGELDEGADFSQGVTGIRAGNYVCRYFAVTPSETYVLPLVYTFTAGSSVFRPACMYVTATSATGKARVYDGNRSTACDLNAGIEFVFPLAGLDPDTILSSLRVWARTDGSGRILGMPVEVSYDDIDLDEGAGVYSETADHVVKTNAAMPAMTWVAAGGFTNRAELVEYCRDGETSVEMTVGSDRTKRMPTYVRLKTGTFTPNNTTVAEIELRSVPLPAEPEGSAALGEVGSSFAKVSGHLLQRGRADSDCLIWFVATPSGGAAKWNLIAEDVTTGDDFAANVKKLKPETDYTWQVVASNALAGAVLGSGAFTTLPGSESDAPTVTFDSVTANADGSVTIGYNVTSAGGDCDVADVYLHYGTDPDDLSETKLIAAGVLGAGSVQVTGLPLGSTLYLALTARNEEEEESDPTEQKSCETVGPCGLANVLCLSDGRMLTASGTLSPRGVGTAVLTLQYGEQSGVYDHETALGMVTADQPAAFSFGTSLAHSGNVYCRVKAVNTLGDDSWTSTSEEFAVAFGGAAPTTWSYNNSPSWCKSFAAYYGGGSDTATFDLDAGRLLPVTGVRFMLSAHGSALTRMTHFMVKGSADGTTFTTIFTNNAAPLVQGGKFISRPLAPGCAGNYRYFRLSTRDNNGKSNYVTVNQVRPLTTALVVEGERPHFWTDEALGSGAATDVIFAGRLLFAATGSARLYVAVAKRDRGTSLAAWRAGGTVFDVGTVSDGAAFAVTNATLAGNAYVCRYFAVSGNEEYTPPEAYSFSANTTAYFPAKAYVLNAGLGSGNFTLAKAYDGSTATRPDLSGGEKDVVFSLADLPKGWRLASVRIWGSSVRDRILGTPVSVSYDDVDLETGSSAYAASKGREMRTVAAFPDALTWTKAGELQGRGDVTDFWRSGSLVTEITLDNALCRRHPKYVKVNKGTTYSGYCTAEVEFRIVKDPGLSIVVR